MTGAMVDQLEAHGYRVTGARRKVVEAILRLDREFTAEELCHQLPGVGRATVYRSIKLLVEEGALCRVLLENGSLQYRVGMSGHHHHMSCVVCGSVSDLVGCDVGSEIKALAERSGFDVEGHWLEVYGRCPSCRLIPGVASAPRAPLGTRSS